MTNAVLAAKPRSGSNSLSKSEAALNLDIHVLEATPWPALKITVLVALPDARKIPLTSIRSENGAFYSGSLKLKPDPLDALLVRTLLQQPKADDNAFLVGAREFAAVMALLRQHSPACSYQESRRVAQVEILSTPSEAMLEITQSAGNSGADQSLHIVVRTRFRCGETSKPLGDPLYRSSTYWTFNSQIAPPPALPSDELLKKLFDGPANKGYNYCGTEALDVICRARAAKNEGIVVTLDARLAQMNVSVEPLKEKIAVKFDDSGNVIVKQELLTPDGKPVPAESIKNAINEAKNGWVTVSGRAYRVPVSAPFRLPQERKISGDAIADFLRDELPKLKNRGAVVDAEVDSACICDDLKPALNVEAAEKDPNDAIQAQWCFEADVKKEADSAERLQIAPVEILAAAASGQRYLRRGNVFVRVDRDAVVTCRKELEKVQSLKDGQAEAQDEQIPELLAWARKASTDVHTPWNVYVSEAVDGAHKVKDEPASIKLRLDAEEEENEPWFTLNATFDHGGEELTEEELRKMVAQGQKWFKKNGKWIKVDAEALEKFELSVEQSGVRRHRGPSKKLYYRFKPAARDRVTEIFSLSGTIEHAERFRKFIDQLRGFQKVQSLPTPKGMALSLRSYQQQGFEWLAFLAHYGLNGVLADDMGLGKTAQTIAMITRLKEEGGSSPSLIVTPTSLVDNWRNEVAKFSPGLKVMVYRGSPQRRDKLRHEVHDYDVVLGTYATVRNDASLLRMLDWRYVILDEAHFIKNSAAATTKAIKTIPARHRLALTGTPIQNRLTELWSLFDFLMPDFLGRQMRFIETYEEPIARVQSGRVETKDEQQTGEQAMERLRERIRPFILRRLKTDVASELPPKIENDVFCSLSPEQVALYKGFADSAEAKEAVSEIAEKGDRACTAILAALTSLRKICNHPDLMCLPKNAGRQRITNPLPGYETRSGKLEALGELLQQCREGGHRSLIFCQQTSMMDILGHYLTQHGMKYLRIDGETPGTNRQGLVEKYNADKSIDAFLISTRAGGAGLNLTGADTVIFYDHDWNPANDQQAQDRAYRIGQQRTVNVYRLVCKGTLEEKILRRQAMKKLLANSIVQHDVAGIKALTREELISLFTLSTEEQPADVSGETAAAKLN